MLSVCITKKWFIGVEIIRWRYTVDNFVHVHHVSTCSSHFDHTIFLFFFCCNFSSSFLLLNIWLSEIFVPMYNINHLTLYVINFQHQQIDILDSWKRSTIPKENNCKRLSYHTFAKQFIKDMYSKLHSFVGDQMPDFSYIHLSSLSAHTQ